MYGLLILNLTTSAKSLSKMMNTLLPGRRVLRKACKSIIRDNKI